MSMTSVLRAAVQKYLSVRNSAKLSRPTKSCVPRIEFQFVNPATTAIPSGTSENSSTWSEIGVTNANPQARSRR